MKREQRKQEWLDILDLAQHNLTLNRWLSVREAAYNAGIPSDYLTTEIRKEYRCIIRMQFDEAA